MGGGSHAGRQTRSGPGEEPGLRHRPGGRRGQIVIPQEARRYFGISPGDTLLILGNEKSGLVVTKPEVLHELADEILGKEEENDADGKHV